MHENASTLVLVHSGARIDPTAFQTLGHFLKPFSSQQRAKIALGIGVKVKEMSFILHLLDNIFMYKFMLSLIRNVTHNTRHIQRNTVIVHLFIGGQGHHRTPTKVVNQHPHIDPGLLQHDPRWNQLLLGWKLKVQR